MVVELTQKLREIAGQDTTPPLWIYVTKDQVPVLTQAADAIEDAQEPSLMLNAPAERLHDET